MLRLAIRTRAPRSQSTCWQSLAQLLPLGRGDRLSTAPSLQTWVPSSWLPSLGSLDRRSLLPFACWPDEQLTEHTSEQIHKQTDAQTHEEIGASGYHDFSVPTFWLQTEHSENQRKTMASNRQFIERMMLIHVNPCQPMLIHVNAILNSIVNSIVGSMAYSIFKSIINSCAISIANPIANSKNPPPNPPYQPLGWSYRYDRHYPKVYFV